MKTGRTIRQLQRLSLYVEITPLFSSIVLCPHSPHTERINPRGSSPGANASLTGRHCCPFLGSHHQLRTFQLTWPPLCPSIGLIINIPQKENKAEPRWDGFQPMWLNLTFHRFPRALHGDNSVGKPRASMGSGHGATFSASSDFFLFLPSCLDLTLFPHSWSLSVYSSSQLFLCPSTLLNRSS